ncbi:DUF2752 domain-containing protein [Mycobacterium sp. Y57]|uniref:DUF2752 domain-containing protein n=1 Tax=Mycolicibacterium xanthum TaxID=2796469 RepID=UPI001C85230F|nr:DUF2752 domain-containing protein [Mycolicibacterium xanthum]MBX7435346.1 DUF2752 domain-containing protein [Mycolicibacterium xanthum]
MEPSPAANTRTRSLTAVGTGAALLGALAYVGIGDPHSPGFVFLPCPFKALTGWNCPACGGLRMTHDVLHGDLAAAFVDNAFVLIGLPLLIVWIVTRKRLGKPAVSTPAFVVIIVAAVTWTIVRNLPGFPLVPTLLDG